MLRYPGRRWAFAAVAAAMVCTISALYAQEKKQQQEQPKQQNAQQDDQPQQDQAQDQQNRDRNAERPRLRGKLRAGERPDQAAAGPGQRQGVVSDRDIVAWISVENEAEIQFSEMGQQKSSNEQVKQFAQQMVEAHGQLAQKLRQAAGSEQAGQQTEQRAGKRQLKLGRGREEEESNRDQNADQEKQAQREQSGEDQNDEPQVAAKDQGQQRTARRLRMAEGHTGLTAFHSEIVQQCMQQKQRMLGQKQGADFDKCFIQAQIGGHAGAIATLQVAQTHAQSSELKQALQEAEQTVKQHLDHAIALSEQLGKGEAGEGAQKNPAEQK